MSRQDDLQQLITNHQRRLQKLKEQQAVKGINTPPEVLIEIEDIEAELKKLQAELTALKGTSLVKETPLPTLAALGAPQVFISYSRWDIEFVQRLAADLERAGLCTWWDVSNLVGGDIWAQTIETALKESQYCVVILSPDALASEWVRKEYLYAMRLRLRIIPLLYRICEPPLALADLHYVDFCQSYGQGWHDLLPLFNPARLSFEPELILIPSGEFLMGSDPTKDQVAGKDEQPQHKLYLPDYYLTKTPVTQAQYTAFLKETGHRAPNYEADWAKPYNWRGQTPPLGKENHPVVLVSWDDAVAYCRWLSGVTNKLYRLPTEVEWEKAARGPGRGSDPGRIYPWGSIWDAKRCNTYEGGKGGTTPAGTYPDGASPYGILDLAGNVGEWCSTAWQEKAYPFQVRDEWREDYLEKRNLRVLRGGAWLYSHDFARCAFRVRLDPDSRNSSIGFRVACHVTT